MILMARKYDTWDKRKAAVYLRRSKGESGTTKDQLRRIQPVIDMLIDEKKISTPIIVDEGRSESGFDIDRPEFRYADGKGRCWRSRYHPRSNLWIESPEMRWYSEITQADSC